MWGLTSIIHHDSSVFPLKTYKKHIKTYLFHHFLGVKPHIFHHFLVPKKTSMDLRYVSGGQSLVAAGYVLYSASTELVLTFGQGVVGFTLDTSTWDLGPGGPGGPGVERDALQGGPWVFGR